MEASTSDHVMSPVVGTQAGEQQSGAPGCHGCGSCRGPSARSSGASSCASGAGGSGGGLIDFGVSGPQILAAAAGD